jgi:hypothetical protein
MRRVRRLEVEPFGPHETGAYGVLAGEVLYQRLGRASALFGLRGSDESSVLEACYIVRHSAGTFYEERLGRGPHSVVAKSRGHGLLKGALAVRSRAVVDEHALLGSVARHAVTGGALYELAQLLSWKHSLEKGRPRQRRGVRVVLDWCQLGYQVLVPVFSQLSAPEVYRAVAGIEEPGVGVELVGFWCSETRDNALNPGRIGARDLVVLATAS